MALMLNNITGFETQGFEEAESNTGSITFPTASPRSGAAELSVPAAANTSYRLPWVIGTDAGADYIFGIAIDFASLTDDTSGVVHVRDSAGTVILNMRIGASSKLVIRDRGGNDRITSTNALSTGQYFYIEVYFQHLESSANAELFIDGVSEGTTSAGVFSAGNSLDSSATLSIKSDGSNAYTADDLYILSGATAASDRLGNCEVFGYQTSDTGNTNLANGSWDETGDTPAVPEADGTAVEVAGASSTTAVSDFNAFNDRGQHGGPDAIVGDTYDFNTSDAGPTDNDAVWTNDANAFDGSTSTFASTSTAGSETTNELRGEGTAAPASGGTIVDVFVRGNFTTNSAALTIIIYTDGEGESLLQEQNPNPLGGFDRYWRLTTPSGGWSWAKIQALECIFFKPSGGDIEVNRLEVFVSHSTGSETITPDVSGTIKGAKYIYSLKRTNGSGTSLGYLFGNATDGETSGGNIEADLTTSYIIFEEVSEAAGVVPTASENFSAGLEAGTTDTGGREIFCSDMWAMLLHVPSGGADVNIVVPLGTFSLAGQVPIVGSGASVDTPLETFTLAGQVPIVGTGAQVVTPLGTFTLNSFAPTIETGVTIITPLGTFTLTGQVPTIETGVTVITPLGTFTLAGQVPIVGSGASIVTPLGTFTLNGLVPIVGISATVVTPLGTFTLTGLVPTIETGVTVITPLGTFTLTGFAPVIAAGGVVVVTPLGTFTLTGFVPVIDIGVNIITPLRTFTLTGQIPIIGTGVDIITPLGAFTLTGFAPVITIGANIITPLGTFTLTGLVPTIETGVTIITPLGTFTLTGFAPVVAAGGVVVITPLGTFTLTGQIPIVGTGVQIVTPLGTFTLTGFVPVIGTGAEVITPLGTFTLTGQVPIVGSGAVIITPLGSFTVNFIAPAVASGVSVATPLGTFNLTGFVPTIQTGVNVLIPLGSFTLTGIAPDIAAGGDVVIVTPLGTFTLTGLVPSLHTVDDAAKALNLLDLTPPFEDISQIRYLFHNFALLRDVLAPGVSGQFTTTDGKTIHIRNGVVTDIF